jgi:hypothetical protein
MHQLALQDRVVLLESIATVQPSPKHGTTHQAVLLALITAGDSSVAIPAIGAASSVGAGCNETAVG